LITTQTRTINAAKNHGGCALPSCWEVTSNRGPVPRDVVVIGTDRDLFDSGTVTGLSGDEPPDLCDVGRGPVHDQTVVAARACTDGRRAAAAGRFTALPGYEVEESVPLLAAVSPIQRVMTPKFGAHPTPNALLDRIGPPGFQ
jgi:hypothetical protein